MRSRLLRATCLLASLWSIAGCGDDPECVLDTDCENLFQICVSERCVERGTRIDGGGTEAGPTDGGNVEGGAEDGGMDAGPAVTRTGMVTVTQSPGATEPSHVVTATFTETTDGDDSPCTVTEMSPCTLTDCFFPTPPMVDGGMEPMDAGMPTFPSAGMIVVNGDPTDVVLTPNADGTYPAASGTGQIWPADGMVQVTASGMEVPAFSSTLVGPSASSVGSPSFMTPPITIDRAMDFTFTWSGGSGLMEGRIANNATTMDGLRTVSLLCAFDAAAGTGTFPAALLEQVPTGDAASFTVTNAVEDAPDVTGWTVTVRLTTPAQLDTGAAAATITLSDSTP